MLHTLPQLCEGLEYPPGETLVRRSGLWSGKPGCTGQTTPSRAAEQDLLLSPFLPSRLSLTSFLPASAVPPHLLFTANLSGSQLTAPSRSLTSPSLHVLPSSPHAHVQFHIVLVARRLPSHLVSRAAGQLCETQMKNGAPEISDTDSESSDSGDAVGLRPDDPGAVRNADTRSRPTPF